MTLADITADGIRRAVVEFEALGEAAFLTRYQFGADVDYYLRIGDRTYPSKAIVGVAHRHSGPGMAALAHYEFNGGKATVGRLLLRLDPDFKFTKTRAPDVIADAEAGNQFGHVRGVQVGAEFATRLELARAGVHRATQAGITGTANAGAESIVLSGGYVDDLDEGDRIVYTGHGGRDQNSGRQIADQTFTRQNLALARSESESLPVRVVRSLPGDGPPYRYDGLYAVVRHWHETGRDGFLVYRFELNAAEPLLVPEAAFPEGEMSPGRVIVTSSRVLRDSKVAAAVKKLYDNRCQMCGERLVTASGSYSEAAHIRPLGRPSNGADVVGNVLCLCPNHHVLFDKGAITLGDGHDLLGMPGRLTVAARHLLLSDSLQYHREHIYQPLDEMLS